MIGMPSNPVAFSAIWPAAMFSSGRTSAFHVVELDSVRDDVDAFFRTRTCKPASVSWVPDLRRRAIWYSGHGEDVLTALARPGTKVIVSTEPKAHLGYLRAALGLGLDCLVDKPVVLPMRSNGRPAADHLVGAVAELKEICDRTGGRCAIMTGVCAKSNHDRRRERPSSWDASRAVAFA